MSLIMAIAPKYVSSQEPMARTMMYLDDRTMVAQSVVVVQNAIRACEQL